MIVVNFSHPLTAEQRRAIAALAGKEVARVIEVPAQFDDAAPFAAQVAALVGRTGLSAAEWQTEPMLINLPAFGPIVAVLLAHLHGLCGHFPTVIRLRPAPEAAVPRFEVAELVRLDEVRRRARSARGE